MHLLQLKFIPVDASVYSYMYVHVPRDVSSSDDLHEELSELRSSHADTVAELEKTRQLLAAQRTINQDYKKEVTYTCTCTLLETK